jgi:uncharacterized iron-regulated protein
MATRKSDTGQTPAKTKATESKTSDSQATGTEPQRSKATDTKKTTETYADTANKIAADARGLSEEARKTLDDLVRRCDDLNQTDPGDDTAAADAVRRLPMACSDVTAALQGLAQAAAELAGKTIR